MSATSRTDSEVVVMTKEEFKREKLYQTTMSLARQMLKSGGISEREYKEFDTKMKEKYRPIFGGIFGEYNLLSTKL